MPKIKELTDDQIYEAICDKQRNCINCPLHKKSLTYCRKKDYEDEIKRLESIKSEYTNFLELEVKI